ncbi:damage-control phosphatase ARMT1 family protein [Desulfoferrobacter suflitae]|uniref:damage-control phosphatase ARMT1 family protein n=1 Tax=Desulfoferrobacter suflitae TaxID=2865782 RepID=UPI0021643AE1|nr:ARMT1-like domain-containing protein [Desulfoferrobacter suflitae]
MKTHLDCIPCLIRQALNAVRMVSADAVQHASLMRQVLHWAGEMDLQQPPPVMAQRIHRQLRTITREEDPYRVAKAHQNHMALRLLPELRAQLESASDPLEQGVRLAIAGNVIDMGINGHVTEADLRQSVNQVLDDSFSGDLNVFRAALSTARNILYLADNAGEIVFDRVLIEQLGTERVTLAVRGFPVLNDATREDAQSAGLHGMVEIIDNGSDAPGTLLEQCRESFVRRFHQADLVIAKGQGNFETLSEETRNIFFLFKVKCSVIAAHTGFPVGTHVLGQSGAMASCGKPAVVSEM